MVTQLATTPLGFTHPDEVSRILYAVRDLDALALQAETLGYPLHARYLVSAARFLRAGAALWCDLDSTTGRGE